MSSDGISISITEDVTKVEVTEDVTTINITPSVTTVEAKGISIANASAATAVTYQGLSNTLGTGGNVAASLDHINTNGFNKTLGGTVAGATDFTSTITFTGAADFNNTVSFTSNIDTDLALDSTKRITWGSTGGVQYKFIKGTDGANLELGTGTTTTMFISNNGNVGIGVAIPTSKLDVDGGITGTALDINGDGDISNELVVGTKVESPLFKGDLEGAVHFKASGSGLAKGDVVYISGYAGQRTTVAKADASDSAKMPAFGIVNATQGNNNVDVLTFGSMLHLSTTGIATGTELYVSATTPGGYETSAPTGEGNLIQKIAKVVRGDSNSGSIKIMGAGRTNATPNLNDGNIFIGNSSNIPTTASFDTTFGTSLATRTTTDLTEGDNEYYTSARADARVDLQTGSNLDLSQKTTTDLAEGDNEYYTDAKVGTYISGDRSYGNITTTGYLRGPSTFTIDPSGHGDNTGTVVIAGDLQVDGTTTTINSTELTIEDKVLTVAGSATTNSEAHGAGISFGATNTGIFYSSSRDGLRVFGDVQFLNDTTINAAIKTNSGDAGSAGQALLSTGTSWEWGDISTTLNVEADSGDTQAIEMLTENLDIAGGTGISTATTDNTVTVKLDDTAVAAGTYGAAKTIPQITVDGQGRITSATEITGQVGEPGGISLNKRFSTDAYNLAAFGFDLKLNSADVSLVTQAKISHDAFMIDPSNGTNITIDYESFLDDITTIDADCLGYFHIYKAGEPTTFATYKITAGSAFSGNNAYTLEHIASRIPGSETTFTDEEHIVLSYSRAGADGSTADVNTALGTSSASDNEVLSWTGSAFDWVPQSGGIALTDLSVTTETAGAAALTYSNATGVFTYTPPDLSSYLTTVAFSDLTSKPTTISGYGITDAFDGVFSSLTSKPTTISGYGITDAFDGVFSSLTSKPTTISGYGITDALELGTTSTTALAGDSSIEDLSNVSSNLSPTSNSVLAYNTTDSEYQPYLLNDIAEIENQYIEVSTGAGVIAHRPYYASAWDGANNRPIVTLTDADNEQPCIGIATETVGSGSVTKLLTKGILINVNTGTTNYPGTGNILYISSDQGGLTRTAPVSYQTNLQQVATVLKTDLSTGAILVDITASQVGVANLAHNYIAYGGPNGEQTALYDDVSLPIRASAGPSGSREYWNVLRLTDASNNYTGDINHIQIGQAEADDDSQLIDKISLFPGANGVRIHNSEAIGTEGVTGQTLAFHTTDDGIHVGNDRRGTYTAGDVMINNDTDFGMLVGSTSVNYGRNNFGFGYGAFFESGTNENFSMGALNTIKSNISDSVSFGTSNVVGNGVNSGTSMLGGGFLTKTTGNYGFTWGYGYSNNVNIEEFVLNHAQGGVVFGQQSILGSGATNSFVGGGIGGNSENFNNHRVDSTHCFNYGKSSHIDTGSNHSGAIGLYHVLDTAPQGFAAGEVQRLTNTRSSAAVGRLHELGSAAHATGNDYLFAAGYKNEPLGNGGMCLGYQLKTPLNRATSDDPYEWEDGCTVVGAHNDPLKKFDTDDGVGATWVQNQRFVVGTGVSAAAPTTGFVVAAPTTDFSGIIMTHLAESTSHANPAAARTAGVPTGGLYRTGNDVKILLAGD